MSADKVQELSRLIQLYESGIERHETLLRKVLRGKEISAQIGKEKYIGLVRGDIKLMKEKKSELDDELRELEIKAIQDSIEDQNQDQVSAGESDIAKDSGIVV